jgi:hypothetical protein
MLIADSLCDTPDGGSERKGNMSGVPGLATAADYSEAMAVARRAKSVIALLLLLMLVVQLTLFFLIRYDVIPVGPGAAAAATQPADAESARKLGDVMHYVTGLTILGGIGLGILLALVLSLINHIMLVGRLIGVGKVTSSLIWTLVLIVFLFPWQTFMNNDSLTNGDFRIPGVLWTWGELMARVDFPESWTGDTFASTLLSWFRFAGAPVIAAILVLIVQLKSNRGIKMAMGEDEVLNEMMRAQ